MRAASRGACMRWSLHVLATNRSPSRARAAPLPPTPPSAPPLACRASFLDHLANGRLERAWCVAWQVNSVRHRATEKMDVIKAMLHKWHIPIALVAKTKLYYHHYLMECYDVATEQRILKELCPPLRTEVLLFLNARTVESIHFFRGQDSQFIVSVCKMLKPCFFAPQDWIFKEGELGLEMYFMQMGAVDMVCFVNDTEVTRQRRPPTPRRMMAHDGASPTPLVPCHPRPPLHACHHACALRSSQHAHGRASPLPLPQVVLDRLEPGSYFGEVAVLVDGLRREASARAVSFCAMFSFTKQSLTQLLNMYPEVSKAMQRQMETRLRKYRLKRVVNKILHMNRVSNAFRNSVGDRTSSCRGSVGDDRASIGARESVGDSTASPDADAGAPPESGFGASNAANGGAATVGMRMGSVPPPPPPPPQFLNSPQLLVAHSTTQGANASSRRPTGQGPSHSSGHGPPGWMPRLVGALRGVFSRLMTTSTTRVSPEEEATQRGSSRRDAGPCQPLPAAYEAASAGGSIAAEALRRQQQAAQAGVQPKAASRSNSDPNISATASPKVDQTADEVVALAGGDVARRYD